MVSPKVSRRARWIGALVLSVIFVGSPVSIAQGQGTQGPKLRIAVMNLSDDALAISTAYAPTSTTTTIEFPPPEGFALGLTEMLTTSLVEAGRFVVLERTKIDDILEEQDFGASGRVNVETAAAQGSVIGAQALVTGGITEFSYTSSSVGGVASVLQAVGVKAEQVKAKVALDIRVLDAVTGEVLFSKKSTGEASAKAAAADVEFGSEQFSTAVSSATPLGKASRDAIQGVVDELVKRLSKIPWSGRIIDVRGDLVYINAGRDDGITPGMEFEVFAQEEALIDPATGRTLGAPERTVGSLRVVQIQPQYAVAEVTAGAGFERNQILRFLGQGRKP